YHGVVKISAKKIERGYEISIEDNGVGIDSDIISNLDSEIEKNIGLKNVHNRLRFLYGKGLNIEQLEKGTKISFNILKEAAC
nr:sensor histidine kinase [Fusobacteriaceae bacterium]